MAKAKLISTCAFLLLLVFSGGIISTDGRLLISMERSANCEKCAINEAIQAGSRMPAMRSDNRALNDRLLQENPHGKAIGSKDQAIVDDELAEEVADYRPTTPGHSPGVGHGNGPSSIGPDT